MSVRSMIFAAWLSAGVLAGASLGLVACGESDGLSAGPGSSPEAPVATADQAECGVGAPVVDPALLAFLSKAKSLHHRADMAEEDEQPELAIALLEQLVDGPTPGGPGPTAGGTGPSPEVREVVADTLARIAEIRSARGADGDIEAAKKAVDRGLALAEERTHFRGRLMEVRGVVEQRHRDKLLEAGDEKGAEEAKQRAIAAFEQAVEIQDEVIKRALSEDDAPTGP